MKTVFSILMAFAVMTGLLTFSTVCAEEFDGVESSYWWKSGFVHLRIGDDMLSDMKILTIEDFRKFVKDYFDDNEMYQGSETPPYPEWLDFEKYGADFFDDRFLYIYQATSSYDEPIEFVSTTQTVNSIDVEMIKIMRDPASASNGSPGVGILILEIDRTLLTKEIKVKIKIKESKVSTPMVKASDANGEIIYNFTFIDSADIVLGCYPRNATIHYTLDGSTPTTSSPIFDGSFTITETTTIKAIGIKDGYEDSNILTAVFKLVQAEMPTCIPNGGKFSSSQEITLDCATEDAKIYYTTDGTEPNPTSTEYTEPFTITETATIKAIAVKSSMSDSEALTVTFTKQTGGNISSGRGSSSLAPAIPTANPKGGDVEPGTMLTLTTSYKDSKIYYTTDGSTPTENSTLYTTPIVIDKSMTVQYIALINGQKSNVGNQTFTLQMPKAGWKSNVSEIRYIKGYLDGTFKPDTAITRYEMLMALNYLVDIEKSDGNNAFADVPPEYDEVVGLFEKSGIVEGYSDGEFKGERSLTRAEFVNVMSLIMGMQPSQRKSSFDDVSTHWAHDYIAAFTNEGYIKGYEDGLFHPDSPITRAEFTAVVNRITKNSNTVWDNVYTDVEAIHWAYDDIMKSYLQQEDVKDSPSIGMIKPNK